MGGGSNAPLFERWPVSRLQFALRLGFFDIHNGSFERLQRSPAAVFRRSVLGPPDGISEGFQRGFQRYSLQQPS